MSEVRTVFYWLLSNQTFLGAATLTLSDNAASPGSVGLAKTEKTEKPIRSWLSITLFKIFIFVRKASININIII